MQIESTPAPRSESSLVDRVAEDLMREGFELSAVDPEMLAAVEKAGFNRTTMRQVLVLAQIVAEQQPITVRGAFYRAVSAGVYPDTDDKHYRACCYILLNLRRAGVLDYDWIVDSTRRREKPSSWSGLQDYAETVAHCYRRSLWSEQKDYLEFFVEKDAMAAVILPVTQQYDVHLNVIRGCVSESFVWSVAQEWREIKKPIRAFYLGDFDPSGLMIEKDLIHRLEQFSGKPFSWQRLAITQEDFFDRSILGFHIKGNRDTKAWQTKHREYLANFDDRCVEVDALPTTVIRERIRDTIEGHIDQRRWKRLQEVEAVEKETVKLVLAQQLGKA